MLLVSIDETFEDINNYDDFMGKVEDIPTAVIRKSDGDIIKDFIKMQPDKYKLIHMVMKFKSVNKYFNCSFLLETLLRLTTI